MLARRLRFGAVACDERADDLHRDHGIIGRKGPCQKAVEHTKRPRFVLVPVASGALAVQKPLQRRRERRGEGWTWSRRHARTSCSDSVTRRRAARSIDAYSIVDSVEACPSTSPMLLIGHSAESIRVARVCRKRYKPRRPGRGSSPARWSARRMIAARLLVATNGSKGARCRTNTCREAVTGRPSRRYGMIASVTSGR